MKGAVNMILMLMKTICLCQEISKTILTMKTSMNRLIPLMLLDFRIDNSSLALRKL